MKRRTFITLLSGAALPWPGVARSQNRGRTRLVGYLRASPPPARELDALKRGLAEHGYADGRNLVIVPGWGDGDASRLPALATSLVAKNVDIIVAEGSVSVRAANDASPTVAIVMTRVADPFGLVSSLSRPGGNITGVTTQGLDITSKMIEVLKELVPSMSRIALLGPSVARSIFGPATERAAHALGFESIYIELTNPNSPGDAILQAISAGASGSIFRGAPYLSSAQRKLLAIAAAEHRLPTIYEDREFVEYGGLMFYGADVIDLYRRTGEYVARILNGAAPGELPVQQPIKFELAINLKTAKALGLTIPPKLLFTADEVIE